MEKQLTVNLDDLIPTDVDFELDRRPGEKFTLGAYTLRVQIWASKEFGKEQLQTAIHSKDAVILSQLAWHVLKQKDRFKSYDDFLDAFVTFKDRDTLMKTILATVGLSQPIIEKLAEQLDRQRGNGQSPVQQTGANSTTQSPASTPGVPPSAS